MSTNETNASDPGREVQPAMSIAGGPGGLVHEPIHESLTLTALISAGFGVNNGTNFGNASNADWEYIRGAVWNDDPNLLLFEDEPDTNHTYSTGLTWTYWYKTGASQWSGTNKDPARWKNPTGRSHYGDLQFLHCMASDLGEQPAVTKQKIMTWLEVLYQLANGEGITPDTLVSATKLSQFCPDGSLPPSWKPFSYLFGKESSFNQPDYTKRALGSMLHFIQDSYALGHTRRTLLNPQDKASDSTYHRPVRIKEQADFASRSPPLIQARDNRSMGRDREFPYL